MKNACNPRCLLMYSILFSFLWGCFGCGKNPSNSQRDVIVPQVAIIAPEDNETVSGIVTIQATASDNVGVKKVYYAIDGNYFGAATAAPWEIVWDTATYEDGQHAIGARSYDLAGNASSLEIVTVTVVNKFEVTFTNNVFTDITLNVTGQSVQIIQPSQSLVLTLPKNPGTLVYSAFTSGKTAQGAQVGLGIEWGTSVDVTGMASYAIDLNVNADLFFLYIKNSGHSTFTPLYVNYGTTEQTLDNISVPPDGVQYRLGYYKAFSNTEVRLYFQNDPSSWIYWTQGIHFTLPFTANQSVTLLNTDYMQVRQMDSKVPAHRKLPEPQLPVAVGPLLKSRPTGSSGPHAHNFNNSVK
jgi:hypothetical protein